MKFKLRFRSEQETAECALYLDDRGYCVKLMGSALMVSDIDSADLAIAQRTYTAWIDENATDFDMR